MSLPLLHAGRTNPGLSAALDLRFALDKSLTAYRGPTPSFSRASTGSYFDGSGVLRYAALNILTYSEDFTNAVWTKTNATITANAILSPDGKLTADKISEDSASAKHRAYATPSVAVGTIYTFSVYAKSAERNWLAMNYADTNANMYAYFNLQNGTIGSVDASMTASITSVGNGWYRCSVTKTLAAAGPNFDVGPTTGDGVFSYAGTIGSGIYIWGAQLEASSTVGTYCPTTSSANSAPRFNHTYNGTSWVSRGLLVEEQRTNQVPNSEAFSNWTAQSGSTVTDASVNGPKGSNTASIINEGNLSVDYKGIFQILGNSVAAVYSFSVFAKYNNLRYIAIQVYDGPTGYATSIFDLLNGSNTATTSSGNWSSVLASSTDCGNGWYRLSMQVTSSGAVTIVTAIRPSNAGTGFSASYGAPAAYTGTNRTSYIFGAQLEQGSFPTSYTGTTSASVTRSADVCQITGSDFSGFWNGTEGSIAAEYDLYSPSVGSAQGESFLWQVDDGTNNNRIVVAGTSGSGASNKNRYAIIIGASPQVFIDNQVIPANVSVYSSAAWKLNDAAFYSGSNGLFDTSTAIPTGQSNLRIGQRTGDYYLNGHIARLRYYNKRLPNATLQLLSEPDPTLNLQFALNKSLTPVAGPAPSFSRASTGTFFNASGVLTSASINTPRFDHVYSGGQWVSRGLFLEEQRTNNCYFSNTFSNAVWEKYDSSISSSGAGPDGSTASLLTENTANGPHWLRQQTSASVASGAGVSVTASIFVKANGRSVVGFGFDNSFAFTGKSVRGRFDLSDGSFANEYNCDSYSITNVGNGWYRLSVTSTAVQAGVARFDFFLYNSDTSGGITYTGDGSSGVYVFGAQIEQGAFLTSYTGTTSSSVTRSADVCQITGTSFGWMWNQGEGSVVADFDFFSSANVGAWTALTNTTNIIQLYRSGATDLRGFVYASGIVQADFSIGTYSNPSKSAVAYKSNDFAGSANGAAVGTDTSGTIPSTDKLYLMAGETGNIISGHIAKLIYYPARLTNTKLQQLST